MCVLRQTENGIYNGNKTAKIYTSVCVFKMKEAR